MNDPQVGFVGLGVMGLPMAANLARAGYALTVCDRDPAAIERAAAAIPGVAAAHTPEEVARASTVVVDHVAVRQIRAGSGSWGRGAHLRIREGERAPGHLLV